MKFICEKLPFLAAILTASRAAATKSPVQLLEGLLVEACEDNTVRISGYDLKIGIVTTVLADVESPGGIVLNARLFGEIIRKMPGQYVEFSINSGAAATIVSEMSEFEILGTSAADYPELPSLEGDTAGVEIDEGILKKMISQTNFAVSDNEIRPIHTGALFEIAGGELTIVAVDGYRLAMRRERMEPELPPMSFVVPGVALGEIERIASDGEDSRVAITLSEKHIMFTLGGTTLITRKLEGEFLNYKNSIPQTHTYTLKAEKSEFIKSVERVSLITGDKIRSPVRCVFGDGIVQMSTMSALGRAADECAIEGNADKLEIGFNDKYLLEALRAAPSEEVNLLLSSSTAPCIISPTDGSDGFLYMILPVRLKTYES